MAKEPGESKEMETYFAKIEEDTHACYAIASEARKQGFDPEPNVDIKIAKNMAERVEGLIGTVAPELIGSGMTKRIGELENKYSPMDWRVALLIAEEVAKEKFCRFRDRINAMEVAIRVGFAYHTGGIVAAPLEGFIELKTNKRLDGKEYLVPCYAGPIRGAGGTAAAFSVILTDYIGTKMGYSKYDCTDEEANRYKTEIRDYHERITNLQYFPSDEEITFLAKHLPVEVSGDPTEKFEVSNYKDLKRVETNRIRGGIALVIAEGIAQKAPKLWKRIEKWGHELGLEWDFLKNFLELQRKIKSKQRPDDIQKKDQKISPNYTYLKDLVAGRPILGFPMTSGSFRLRYGRSRVSGYSAASISPATMALLDNYIAIGTQLKVERPGKAASLTACDSICGPIVKLNDGLVAHVSTTKEAKAIKDNVAEIIYLGDILFNYGDFSENNHPLVPPGYCEEWWTRELEKKSVELFGTIDCEKLSNETEIGAEDIDILLKNPYKSSLSARAAINMSTKLSLPLHPSYTYFWTQISQQDLALVIDWLKEARISSEDNIITRLILPYDKKREKEKRALELIGLPHLLANHEFVVVEKDNALAFLTTLGYFRFKSINEISSAAQKETSVLGALNSLSGICIKDKAGTFIGARMGRPEKAKMREMAGSPHILFPVGEEGGRLRSFQSAMEAGFVQGEFPTYFCQSCNKEIIYQICPLCGKPTKKTYFCRKCNATYDTPECKNRLPNDNSDDHLAKPFKEQKLPIKEYFGYALSLLAEKTYPDLIKGVRGTSNKYHIPEYLFKGILRAKHDIYINKDGTIRFDITELPITHFRPKEIGTSIEKLVSLGYSKDMKGAPLTDPGQIVELFPQDVILPAGQDALDEQSDVVLFRVAKFIDELLVKLYKLPPYYNLASKSDLVGHYLIGLAPHISAGTVIRIIGFSETQGLFAHPLFHAAMRRDCDGDEAGIMLLMDAFLNFSRQYLPNTRGAKTMDAPLVLSSKIIPSEIDDMVQGVDVMNAYPLEFYEAASNYRPTTDIKIEQVKARLNTPLQYEGYGFTHPVSSINLGVRCSAYKSLPSMEDKLKGQMALAERIRAVDEAEVAKFVIEKHLLKDTKGNLRKFSMQQFRCVKCNEKFRRPPLSGKCTRCGGKIIFTISEGSVIKYLQPMLSLAEKYNLPPYLKQTLELLSSRVEEVFGKEKETQEGLGKWFG